MTVMGDSPERPVVFQMQAARWQQAWSTLVAVEGLQSGSCVLSRTKRHFAIVTCFGYLVDVDASIGKLPKAYGFLASRPESYNETEHTCELGRWY